MKDKLKATGSSLRAKLAARARPFGAKALSISKAAAGRTKKQFNSFHALHSSAMDKVDYTFRFSTEILVGVLTLIVIATNLFGVSRLEAMAASSDVALLFMQHPGNKELYTKVTSSTTSVLASAISGGGLISTADADALASDSSDQPTAIGDNAVITDNTINNPNPDTVRNLITDQLKVYVTQPGDTLGSIAKQFNLSVNTVAWANNLTATQTIKPGWDLVILPTDGVVHTVTANDTLPDIAKEFNVSMDTIISYNNLANDDDINPGDLLIIPGGTVTPPPQPKPEIASRVTTKKNGSVTVYEPISTYSGTGHSFPRGECTWYVAQEWGGIPWGGNAKDWFANARAFGAKEGHAPEKGSIVVFHSVRGESYSRYGHVAIVISVGENSFAVSEMNYEGYNRVDTRTVSDADPAITGFIY